MNKPIQKLTTLILLSLVGLSLYAQQDTVGLVVRSNVTKDAIQLRWVANSASAWYFTNKNGVIIERYTLMRGDAILDTPEKVVLTPNPLKPPVLNAWKDIAQKDQYAAIIAQALYGKDFEVSGGQKGISEIIALSQEQEQRYAMSMYAADLSYPAALFAGWGYEDKTVQQGERYLYRIAPVSKDPTKHIEIATVYVGLDDYQELPRPMELDAMFGNNSVLLTWNYQLLLNYYNTYYLECSEDGRQFKRLNETPLTNITDSERIFYTDSIQNDKTYHYRVVGLTPFGQEGPYSDTIQGMGVDKLIYVPQITRIEPHDNGNFNIFWEFDEKGNSALSHFELQRGNTDKGPFEAVVNGILPEKRSISYGEPYSENYLRIAAIAKEGQPTYSFPRLLQLVDSIPPAIPVGLTGEIDTLGIVRLSWTPNTEPDMLGYRIFRGQTQGGELVPMNDIAIVQNSFSDTISLNNLNAKVYYAITALDQRYNQSGQSVAIVLVKPLKVKPAPPYISKCEASDNGIELEWIPGNDETITSYSIWRGEQGSSELEKITTIADPSVTNYSDESLYEGVNYIYEVRSINQGNIESSPSLQATAKSKVKTKEVETILTKFSGQRNKQGILLKWELKSRDIQSISIYRKESETSFYYLKDVDVWDNEMLDAKIKNNTTYEYMIVLKDLQGRPTHKQIKVN